LGEAVGNKATVNKDTALIRELMDKKVKLQNKRNLPREDFFSALKQRHEKVSTVSHLISHIMTSCVPKDGFWKKEIRANLSML
jgi:hypothetical protein